MDAIIGAVSGAIVVLGAILVVSVVTSVPGVVLATSVVKSVVSIGSVIAGWVIGVSECQVL